MGNKFSFNFKTMDGGRNIDMPSHLFVVEASGDSEVGSDPNTGMISEAAHDEDDAESCSHDVSDHYSRAIDPDGSEFEAQGRAVGDDNYDEEDDEDEQGEEVNGHQRGNSGGCLEKSRLSGGDTTKEPLSEKEKSKLFWEACLTS